MTQASRARKYKALSLSASLDKSLNSFRNTVGDTKDGKEVVDSPRIKGDCERSIEFPATGLPIAFAGVTMLVVPENEPMRESARKLVMKTISPSAMI